MTVSLFLNCRIVAFCTSVPVTIKIRVAMLGVTPICNHLVSVQTKLLFRYPWFRCNSYTALLALPPRLFGPPGLEELFP